MLRVATILGFSFLALLLPAAALGEQNGHSMRRSRRHSEVARRAPGDISRRAPSHENARYSWYDVGMGACGQVNVETDFIVALNADEFGSGYPGPNCFKAITIAYGGKQTQAQIMDRCPGCPYGGLDMSKALFEFFVPVGTGIFHGQWWYSDDAPAPTTTQATPTSTPPATTSTRQPDPTSTSTSQAPTTSSTVTTPSTSSTPTPSSSTQGPGSTSAQPSSQADSNTATGASSTPAASGTSSAPAVEVTVGVKNDGAANALDALSQVIMGMSGLVVAGGTQSS